MTEHSADPADIAERDMPGERRRLVAVDPGKPAPVRVPALWDAQALLATDFPAPKWAVPGIICEGLSLLAGPPKVG
ncbi:MAG: hypothetical protein QG597_4729, partial [Actinomycetota bacterium]|nr:hypothetical protein [Actinomycetota bacterium]